MGSLELGLSSSGSWEQDHSFPQWRAGGESCSKRTDALSLSFKRQWMTARAAHGPRSSHPPSVARPLPEHAPVGRAPSPGLLWQDAVNDRAPAQGRYATLAWAGHSASLHPRRYVCGSNNPAGAVSGGLARAFRTVPPGRRTIRLGYVIQFAWSPPRLRGIHSLWPVAMPLS